MIEIASWNVNSIRARLEHVTAWLKARQPDVLLLQELKGAEFPADVFKKLGYESVAVTQKAYNGVAILSRRQGHVFPGGFSLQHDFRPSLTLGAEIFGAYTRNGNLGKSQLQAMAGGRYLVRKGLNFCFGMLGGKYVASPRLGAQIGFEVDFPDLFGSSPQ
jgi:exonuclease III